MQGKHYLSLLICGLIIFISGVFFYEYLEDFVFPESYVIGSADVIKDYERYEIGDYLQDEDIIFSKSINSSNFTYLSSIDGFGSYKYTFRFDSIDFTENVYDYELYVNDYMAQLVNDDGGLYGCYDATFIGNELSMSMRVDFFFKFHGNYSEFTMIVSDYYMPYLSQMIEKDGFVVTLCNATFERNQVESLPVYGSIPVSINNSTNSEVLVILADGETLSITNEVITFDIAYNLSFKLKYTSGSLTFGNDGSIHLYNLADDWILFTYSADCTFININIMPRNVVGV